MLRIKWFGEQEERYYRELHWLKFEQTPLEYLELINYEREYDEWYSQFLRCGEFGRRGPRITTKLCREEGRRLTKLRGLETIKERALL